jgi:hypothetical protein
MGSLLDIRAEVREALAEFETAEGVCIPGTVWIATATGELTSSGK